MRWTCLLDGEGGTGYLNDGHLLSRKNRPFAGRLARDRRDYRPDVVVVDGGRNDGQYPVADVTAAVTSYLRDLHRTYPRARLVLIAPTYVSTVTPADYGFGVQLAERLQELGRPYRAVVVEPLGHDWFGDEPWRNLVEKDGIHPDQAAHAHFARVLAAQLRAAGLNRLTAPARSL